MSEFTDEGTMSDMSDMSDLDSDAEDAASDSEGSDLEWESDSGDEAAEGAPKPKKVAAAADDSASDDESDSDAASSGSDDSGSEESDSDDEVEHAPRKKKRPAPEAADLETAYERRPAAPKPKKARLTKLPTIDNGQVRAPSPLDRSPSPSPEPSPEPETRKEVEYRSDPLGQRFGRPAVRQLLEIKDKQERVSRAREEIADLGRDASGTGEGEGGVSSGETGLCAPLLTTPFAQVNLLKRLLSLTGPKFSSSSAAKSAGERPVMVDREIRIMAMISLLAVFVDIVPCAPSLP